MADDSGTTLAAVRVDGDDGGELSSLAGNILALYHARAFPPGRPLECVVQSVPAMELTGRTVGSKKQDDGRFLVRVRLTNLRKEHRAALVAMIGAADPD